MNETNRYIHVIIAGALMGMIVFMLFPSANGLFTTLRTHAYHYRYTPPQDLIVTDVSTLPPAQAVPILMYHGVITHDHVDVNTQRGNFIEQMEMLKREGYETISVEEYDMWREGMFELPPKPIILTFDDGRKDSFYTVDSVLEGLGFKATLFVATIKANEEESFYLNWEELKRVKETGRWEIEAHGRHSHELVKINSSGEEGRYLTSRLYGERGGLESVEDYEKRVEADYEGGIHDLKENLGIGARYFSIPLNDYGFSNDSNHPGALLFNAKLTERYFKLAFVQALQEDTGEVKESFYNYIDSPAYKLKRLEVRNMDAKTLLEWLQKYEPREPFLALTGEVQVSRWKDFVHVLYGTMDTSTGKLVLSSNKEKPSARVQIGDSGWSNYAIEARLDRRVGSSTSLLAYYLDEDNYVGLVWGGMKLSLVKRLGGIEYELDSVYPIEVSNLEIRMLVYNGTVVVKVGEGIFLTGQVREISRGSLALSTWDPHGAEVALTYLEVMPVSEPWIEENLSGLVQP